MGLTSTKSSITSTKYTLMLSSANNFYRSLSVIEGEVQMNIRTKLCVEKKIRIDLIGQLVQNKHSSHSNKMSTHSNEYRVFFTYSFPLVTSHENGIARIIKNRQNNYAFRIPLGINLPPSCELKQFSIVYFLDVYHDGRLLPNIRKKIILAPPVPPITTPLSCKVTGSYDRDMICSVQKSFYSGRDASTVILSILIKNPTQKRIESVIAQLIQNVSLNETKFENEFFTKKIKELNNNTQENFINTICELNLPPNLPPTYIPNEKGQPDNVPRISIAYELRITVQMNSANISNIRLSVPIVIV